MVRAGEKESDEVMRQKPEGGGEQQLPVTGAQSPRCSTGVWTLGKLRFSTTWVTAVSALD